MPRKKTEIKTEKIEPIIEPIEESQAKKDFRALLAQYQKENPVKYRQKEEQLIEQLNQMK